MKTFFKFFIIAFIVLTVIALYYFYPTQPLPENARITKLVVWKSQRKMMAYQGESLIKTYRIALGANPVGHKQFKYDEKTPEGIYKINDRNPKSSYYKNLGISYPNNQDVSYAAKLGKNPGGAIKIHGVKNNWGFIGKFHRLIDWTDGCIAVTNEEMEDLYQQVNMGATIEILP